MWPGWSSMWWMAPWLACAGWGAPGWGGPGWGGPWGMTPGVGHGPAWPGGIAGPAVGWAMPGCYPVPCREMRRQVVYEYRAEKRPRTVVVTTRVPETRTVTEEITEAVPELQTRIEATHERVAEVAPGSPRSPPCPSTCSKYRPEPGSQKVTFRTHRIDRPVQAVVLVPRTRVVTREVTTYRFVDDVRTEEVEVTVPVPVEREVEVCVIKWVPWPAVSGWCGPW